MHAQQMQHFFSTALRKLLLCAACLLCFELHAAQSCQVPNAQSPTNMLADENGWVTDPQSGLMWQRCSLGQIWHKPHCQGQAQTYTYSQALEAVQSSNQQSTAGFNDWKLPHLKELAFIAHPRCQNPRVNLDLFPDTPAGVFWSRYTRIVNDFDPHVFTMDFAFAGVALAHPQESHFVRLVRKLP